MENLSQYLDSLLTFRTPNGSQADRNYLDFWKWQLENHKQIKISSTFDIPELKEFIPKIKKMVKLKGCYMNSCKLIEMIIPRESIELKYIEGYLFSILPIPHAFNKIGNQYFDITKDFAINNQDSILNHFLTDTYYSIIELNRSEMFDYMIKCNSNGEFIIKYFMDHRK